MTPNMVAALRIVSEAEGLLERANADTASLWPRMASLLGRQAIEIAMSEFWLLRAPGAQNANWRGQFLSLPSYFGNRRLALEAFHAWSSLSGACHYDSYELSPSAIDLRNWLEVVREFAENVARQTDGTPSTAPRGSASPDKP